MQGKNGHHGWEKPYGRCWSRFRFAVAEFDW